MTCMKVMENLEKTESNLVISLMTLAIKRKEGKVKEKTRKKQKSHIKQVLIYGLLCGYLYQAFIFERKRCCNKLIFQALIQTTLIIILQ